MWGEARVSIQKILEAYRNQECLWNPKHPGYKNRQDRHIAYINMINDLNMPELTQNDIRLKIKSIRTCYRKELVLYLRRKSEGHYNAPKLVWFNQAHSFLKNVSVSKPAREVLNKNDNINKYKMHSNQDDQLTEIVSEEYSFKDDTEDPIHLDNENEYQKPTASEVNKFVVSTDEDSMQMAEYIIEDNQLTNFRKMNQNNTNSNNNTSRKCNSQQYCSVLEPEDEYQKFCNSIAAQLREIPDPYARAMAKFKIQQILFEAETGEYKKKPTAKISVSNNELPNSNVT